MKKLLPFVVIAFWSAQVAAADASCAAQSKEKKLAGAAQNSFMKKCAADAASRCEAGAKEKKLAGAAQNSYTKKCIADATGS